MKYCKIHKYRYEYACFGSLNYDEIGFQKFVDIHRKADPYLSLLVEQQADALAVE